MQSNHDLVKEPIFLVGSERSGTTLARLMLDHHPLLAFFCEFEYSILRVSDEGEWPDLEDYIKYLEADRIFQAARVTIDKTLAFPHLVNSFLVQKRDRDAKPFVGATVHYHFDRLLRIWPDARFIHLLRDGRDVARSSIEMGWAGNMYTAVDQWIHAESLWEEMCKKLPESRRIEVRYESLVSEPVETLTRICNWMGIPYDPEMLSYCERSTYGPPSPKAIGQWKRKLTPSEAALAEVRIGNMRQERGYELSGYPVPELTSKPLRRLKPQDRFYRANFRRKKYGTLLYMTDVLSRRAKHQPSARWTQRKIDKIDTLNLK